MLSALLVLSIPILGLRAQTHLSVDIRDPVYELLELGELKGLLGTLSAVRPFARSQVIELLDRMWEERGRLSTAEQSVLAATRERFQDDRSGLRHGNLAYRSEGEAQRQLQVGGDVRSRFCLDANQPEDWHLDSAIRPYLRGDMGPLLSYYGVLGFTFDRVRQAAFAPYEFTKEWDSFHLSFGEPRTSDGGLEHPTISFDLETEIAMQLGGGAGLALARHRREWGIGDGSLILGGTARPFAGVEVHAQLTPWLAGHYLLGSLNDWQKEPSGTGAGSGTRTYQKLFALQRLEIVPFPWLYLAVSSSILGAKRFELTYMAPLLFGVLAQNLIGDLDNVGVDVDIAVTVPPIGRAYLSFYADEMELTGFGTFFRRPRNMVAVQGGLALALPGLPFSSLTLQYTKIEPFTYAHYPTDYPDYRIPVDTAYTHDGENLAYRLWPNSDELQVKISSQPLPHLRAGLAYRLIRHGDNPGCSPGDLAILGRPDGYLDYTVDLDSYPDKVFLHDGLYDYNHIATLSGDYRIPSLPISLSLWYTFAYTFWEPNDSGEPDRPDTMRSIFGLGITVFR